MPPPPVSLPTRVLIRHHDPAVHSLLSTRLLAAGYLLSELHAGPPASTPAEANGDSGAAAEQPGLDAAIIDLALAGERSGLTLAMSLVEALPELAVIMVSPTGLAGLSADELERTNTMAVMCCPPDSGTLDAIVRLAVQRRRDLAAAREETHRARTELEARKLIERAKGILMRRTGTSEQEAYRIMQRTSQDKSVPMVSIARTVIASEPGMQVS